MNNLISYLYEALASDFGLVLETEDPERLRQKFYALRKGDPDLESLSFVISRTNPESQLWIVKRQPNGKG